MLGSMCCGTGNLESAPARQAWEQREREARLAADEAAVARGAACAAEAAALAEGESAHAAVQASASTPGVTLPTQGALPWTSHDGAVGAPLITVFGVNPVLPNSGTLFKRLLLHSSQVSPARPDTLFLSRQGYPLCASHIEAVRRDLANPHPVWVREQDPRQLRLERHMEAMRQRIQALRGERQRLESVDFSGAE